MDTGNRGQTKVPSFRPDKYRGLPPVSLGQSNRRWRTGRSPSCCRYIVDSHRRPQRSAPALAGTPLGRQRGARPRRTQRRHQEDSQQVQDISKRHWSKSVLGKEGPPLGLFLAVLSEIGDRPRFS